MKDYLPLCPTSSRPPAWASKIIDHRTRAGRSNLKVAHTSNDSTQFSFVLLAPYLRFFSYDRKTEVGTIAGNEYQPAYQLNHQATTRWAGNRVEPKPISKVSVSANLNPAPLRPKIGTFWPGQARSHNRLDASIRYNTTLLPTM